MLRTYVRKLTFIILAIIIVTAMVILGAVAFVPSSSGASEAGQLKEGYYHEPDSATALDVADNLVTYNSSTQKFTLRVDDLNSSTENISLAWASKDRDYDDMYNKKVGNLDAPSGKGFAVEKAFDYGSYNGFGGVLSLKLPQKLNDLSASGTLTANVSATVSMRSTWNMLGGADYYLGIRSNYSTVNASHVSVDGNWNSAPSASDYLSGFALSKSSYCNDGDWGDTITSLSASTTINGAYLGIGISGMAYHWPGYSTPEVRVTNIVITFSYSASLTIKTDNGSFDYKLYENATDSASGNASSGTISAGGTFTKAVTNPYAYVIVTPKNTVTGYQFDYLYHRQTTSIGYDKTANAAPNSLLLSSIATTTYTRAGTYAESALYDDSSNVLYFSPRTYEVIFRANNGTTQQFSKTFKFDTNYYFDNVTSRFSNGGQFGAGWVYESDNASTFGLTSSPNKGSSYAEGATLKNLFPNLTKNGIKIYIDAQWVEVSASSSDFSFANGEITASAYNKLYSDVTYTITKTKPGHTLANVYATYTSGDLTGIKIALEKGSGNTWILYGISGNCTISGEWKANTYSITYNTQGKGTADTNGAPTRFIYGVGITVQSLPTVKANSGYVFKGWGLSITGDVITTQITLIDVAANTTLYAIYDSVTPRTTSSTTSNISSTNVNDWTTVSNYVNGSGYALKYTENGGTFDAASNDENYPAGLYWLYISNPHKPPKITATANPSSDNQQLNSYSHYYIALSQNANKALRAGMQITVSVEISYKIAAYKGKAATKNATAQVSLGIAQGFTSGSSLDNATSSEKVQGSSNWFGASWKTKSGTLSKSLVLTNGANSSSGFTLQIAGIQTCTKASTSEYWSYVGITAVKYSITYSGNTEANSLSLNANGGSAAATGTSTKIIRKDSFSYTLPYNPFSRTGYEFIGWKTDNTSSATYQPGTNLTISSSFTLYAQWRKKNYPVTTFDVYTDGVNSATLRRKQWYVPYGENVNFSSTSNGSYGYSNGTYYIYASAGGGDYSGFDLGGSYQLTYGQVGKTQDWDFAPTGNYPDPKPGTSTTTVSGATGAVWGYFIWNLQAPTTQSKQNATVNYGHFIDLDSLVIPAHNDAEAEFSFRWTNSSGNDVTFYLPDSHKLFTVSEIVSNGSTFQYVITATVNRGGVALSKSASADSLSATINALRLKLELTTTENLIYNGYEQEFPLQTMLDKEYYRTAGLDENEINYLAEIFGSELNTRNGRPWYYADNGNNTGDKWKYGLFVSLLGLGYIDTLSGSTRPEDNLYNGTLSGGKTLFKDAGTYFVNHIALRNYYGSVSAVDNKNYVWSVNNSQTINADSATSTGTVRTIIAPSDSLKLYAFYTQHTFGQFSDNEKNRVAIDNLENNHFDVTQLPSPETGSSWFNIWYLGINGFLGEDYDAYSDNIKEGLSRKYLKDSSYTLIHAAGAYDAYIPFITDGNKGSSRAVFSYAVLNNYGVKISSATASYATESNIKMYWLDIDGNVMNPSNPYDFTKSIEDFAGVNETYVPGVVNNYVIVPKDITLEYTGNTTFTYDGDLHGPDNVVSNGLLDRSKLQEFESVYGVRFNLYFYGIPLPKDWATLSQEAKDAYVKNNKDNKVIVGSGEDNFVTGISKNYISFLERNAGKYGVAVVGTAYCDANGVFHDHESYVLSTDYFYVEWEILQMTVSVGMTTTSQTFGNTNYGGIIFTFNNIVSGDKITLGNVTLSYDKVASGYSAGDYYRYVGLTTSTEITNDSYYLYGSYVGKYSVTISNPSTVTDTASSGLYGDSYGNNYNFEKAYSTEIEIIVRNVTAGAWEYTVDGGKTYSATKPADWTYVYGSYKGVRITLSDFSSADFLTNDISAKAGANITAAEIRDITKVSISQALSGALTASEPIVDHVLGTVTYTFYAYDAGEYGVTINSTVNYTGFDGNVYGNLQIERAASVTFTVEKKRIAITWELDGEAKNSVVYDGLKHTVVAKFGYSASGTFNTSDNLVYYDDYVNEQKIYSKYDKQGEITLSYTGAREATDVNYNSATDTDDLYVCYVAQISGNYEITTESRQKEWEITRRSFTMTFANAGIDYVYDGVAKSIPLNLDGNGIPVSINDFSHVSFNTNASFDRSTKTFSATDAGIYTFSYDAGADGVKVERNWLLTGSNNLTLFVITPRVVKVKWNVLSSSYTSKDVTETFYPSFDDTVDKGDLGFAYSLSSADGRIVHAGKYTITIASLSSTKNNFVLASADDTPWYVKYNSSYYTDSSSIASYSHEIEVLKAKVTLNVSALENFLHDVIYDGQEHGYSLEAIYEGYVKSLLLCDDDKNGYSLDGSSVVGKNVGNYVVTINGFNPYNGYLDYEFNQKYEKTWSITKRELTFTFAEFHDGTNAYVYDGNKHGYSLTVGNLVAGESLTLTFVGNGINVTSPVTIAAVNGIVLYGTAAGEYGISNFGIEDSSVGGVTFLASNYSLPSPNPSKSWSISKRTVTIEWKNTSVTYNAKQYTPDGTNRGVYAVVTNNVGEDAVVPSYGGTYSATNAGSYTVRISDLIGADKDNYKIDGSLSAVWTIEKKTITAFSWLLDGEAMPTDKSVVYDGATHQVSAIPTAGATLDDDGKIYDGDSVKFSYSAATGYTDKALLAGTYVTLISGVDNTNYKTGDNDLSVNWKVLPRTITAAFTADASDFIYNGSEQGLTLTISGFVNTDYGTNLKFKVDTDTTNNAVSASGTTYRHTLKAVNAGSYSVSVSIDTSSARYDCYVLSGTVTDSFKITKKTAALIWSLDGKTVLGAEYDGEEHTVTATISNPALTTDACTVILVDNVAVNAGKYTAKAVGLSNDNYSLDGEPVCEYTITPRLLEISWEQSAEYVYNGKYQSDTLSVSRLVSSDEAIFRISFFTGGVGGTLVKTSSVTKNGSTNTTLTAADFAATIDAGTYYAELSSVVYTADGKANGNYSLPTSSEDSVTNFTIGQSALVLGEWHYSDGTKSGVYTTDTKLIYNSKEYVLTSSIVSSSLFVRDDTGVKDEITLIYANNVAKNVSAGGYHATVASLTGTYAKNYSVPAQGNALDYTILPKEVTIIWTLPTDLIYSGTTKTVTATVASGATSDDDGKIYANDEVIVTSTDNAKRNASSYVATAVALSNPDYVIGTGEYAEGNASKNWTILPRPVALSWSATSLEYDGEEKIVTVISVLNLIAGDSIKFVYSGNKATVVGTYMAKVESLDNGNYTLDGGTDINHEWTITPVVLGFSWSGGNGLVYNGNSQGLTLTVTKIAAHDLNDLTRLNLGVDFVGDSNFISTPDSFSVVFSSVNAGVYPVGITKITGSSANNYALPDNNLSSFSIAKRTITVSWSDGEFVYSKSEKTVSAAVTNVVGGDTVSLSYRTKSQKSDWTSGNGAMRADTYTTEITAVSDGNYSIDGASDLSLSWTINPKTVNSFEWKLDEGTVYSVIYDGGTHTVIASAVSGATTDDDGKIYDGDTLSLTYSASVITNYGLSSVSINSAVNAGEYRVIIADCGNTDYVPGDATQDFSIERRALTSSVADFTDTEFIYDGDTQGLIVSLGNIVTSDNDNVNLVLAVSSDFTGTTYGAERSGTTYSQKFVAINAGTYTFTLSLGGNRKDNYVLAAITREFTIIKKNITTEISADVQRDNIVYRAEAITADDLKVTFGNLVTGESLTLDDGFTVSYVHNGAILGSAPVNAGDYVARISLTSTVTNYVLTGTTDFDFSIIKYEITPDMLSWYLNGTAVSLTSLSFVAGENKTVTASISDSVFNRISGKTISYNYFGFCNCALNASSADEAGVHADHQWFDNDGVLRTDGPVHAGLYWTLVTLAGGDCDNFAFVDFDDYGNSSYFTKENGSVYLTWYNNPNNKAILTPLPAVGDNVAAVSFGVARSRQGLVVEPTDESLPYKGTYYTTQDGLPKVSSAADISKVKVLVNNVSYTYADYSSSSAKIVKNAGSYAIVIYDESAESGEVITDCDLFSDNATLEHNVNLSVTRSKITVTNLAETAWSKTYDKTTSFGSYSYLSDVAFDADTVTDGVITGTVATVNAKYSDYNAGNVNLTFILSGTDASNYYLVFSSGGKLLDENLYTINQNDYVLDKSLAKISPRIITVAGKADKVFDGTNTLGINIVSQDIVAGDVVNVVGTYESEHVGTWAITVSSGNPNYEISSDLAATGTISKKELTVEWTNGGSSYVYDKQPHGVTVRVTGMVGGYEENIFVTGNNVENTVLDAPNAEFSSVDAAHYSVSLSLKTDSDYSFVDAVTFAEWTISKRLLAVSWIKDTLADGKYVYPWEEFSVTYSGVTRSVVPVINDNNIVSGDDVSLTVTGSAYTDAGNYLSKITVLAGADAKNYSLPATTEQAWEIKKAEIVGITMSSLTAVYNGAAQGVELNSYLTQHGEPINAVYSGGSAKTASTIGGNNAIIDVGTATITVSVAETKNYLPLTGITATVTITKADITGLTLSSRNEIYAKTYYSVTLSGEYTQYGDAVSVTYTINGTNGNSAMNAGKYTVVAAIDAGDNYNGLTLTAALNIAKADISEDRITVISDFGSKTYDTQYHGVSITVLDNETQYGEPVTITYYGGEADGLAKNAGVYEINAVVSAGDNYNDFTTESSILAIIAKKVVLSYANNDFTYIGAVQTPSVTFETGATLDSDGKVYDADSSTVRLAVSVSGKTGEATNDTVFRDAGDYILTVSFNSNNYTPDIASAEYTIKLADITGFFFKDNVVTYNGQLRYLGINTDDAVNTNLLKEVSLLASDKGTVEYTYNTVSAESEYLTVFNGVKQAGVYFVKAAINAGGNYKPWTAKATLTINRIRLTGFEVSDKTVTFDGSYRTITATVNPAQIKDGLYYSAQGDLVTVKYSVSVDGNDYYDGNGAINVNLIGGNVAPYTIKVSFVLSDDVVDNYYASDLTLFANLTINPYSLTGIELTGGSFVYDGISHEPVLTLPTTSGYPVYNLNNGILTVTLSASHNGGLGDAFTVVRTGEEALDAGQYVHTVSIAPDSAVESNYVSFAGLSATVVISPAVIADSNGDGLSQGKNVFFNDHTVTYDAKKFYPIISSTSAGSILTDDVSLMLLTKTVHPSNNPAHSDVADVSYLCDGAKFNGAFDAGSYTITATISHKNYVSVVLTANLIVEKANISYFFTGAELSFDARTHYVAVNSSDAYLDDGGVTQINLKGSDKVTVSYTYESNKNGEGVFFGAINADVYSVTATITVSGSVGGNYNVWGQNNSVTATLKILPYTSSVVWGSGVTESYVYNGADRSGAITATFIGADGYSKSLVVSYLGVSGKATGENKFLNAGKYTVTASCNESDADNYVFDNETSVSVDMLKADVTLYLISTSTQYNGNVRYLSVSSVNASAVTDSPVEEVNLFLNDIITVKYTYLNANGEHDRYTTPTGKVILPVGARNAGTYTVTADIDLGDGESNFNDWATPLTATFTVNKLQLTRTGGSTEKVYDGTNEASIGEITGLVAPDEGLLNFSASYDSKNAGENKAIIITAIPANGYEYLVDNYILPALSSGTIIRKVLSVSEDFYSWQKHYDGNVNYLNNPYALDETSGLISGDSVTLYAYYDSKNVTEAKKILFSLSGTDSDNYSITDLDFTAFMEENNVRLILPASTSINWSQQNVVYSGIEMSITAFIRAVGSDITAENKGQITFAVTLTMIKDGDGNLLSSPITDATYRNAGTYEAKADIEKSGITDDHILTNYGIESSTETFVISKAQTAVNWSGLASITYVYNGTDQGKNVSATVTLRGDDLAAYENVNYLSAAFTKVSDGTTAIFRNAGTYNLEARFTVAELENNYSLGDNFRQLTIEKAYIDNIFFSGTYGWKYNSGESRYFFASASKTDDFLCWTTADGAFSIGTSFTFPYDPDIAMPVIYSGGEISHASVNGNNGVKNYGERGIYNVTARVETTENYYSWSGTVVVTVEKGDIVDVDMKGYSVAYDGAKHYVYAFNVTSDSTYSSTFTEIKAADGTSLNAAYNIAIGQYFNGAYNAEYSLAANYATDAGTYVMNATISDSSGNYNDLVIDNVQLIITQRESEVTWEYNDQAEPDFTYNANDQTPYVKARILKVNEEGSTTNRNIYLAISVLLADEIDVYDDLKTIFAVAGNYEFTAAFDEDTPEYEKLRNNYTLSGYVVNVEMKKYTVSIEWYYGCAHKQNEIYSPDAPCVYDATAHGVRAVGIGLLGATMPIKASEQSVTSMINAGTYTAAISEIEEITPDSVTINGVTYDLKYNLNYRLANNTCRWTIAKRPISVSIDSASVIKKYYDGKASFPKADTPEITFSETSENNTVSIIVKYALTAASPAEKSFITYRLTNVIESDKTIINLPITEIIANKSNVLATSATVIFGDLYINSEYSNYTFESDVSGIILQAEDLISPLPVTVMLKNKSHVYNGKTFAKSFNEELDLSTIDLFELLNGVNGNKIAELVKGNKVVGNVSIGGFVDAGKYTLTFTDITSYDGDNATNYDFTVQSSEYEITRRKIAIKYGGLLQSLKQTFVDVTATVVPAESDLTDIDFDLSDMTTAEKIAALEALLANDSFSVSVTNSWKDSSYDKYTRIVGGENAGLNVASANDNYAFDQPVLQITFIKVLDDITYTFAVENADDIKNLDTDSVGLTQTRNDYGVGVIPSYVQQNDVDGVINGAYSSITSIKDFYGNYNGNNYFIRGFNVLQIRNELSDDRFYFGFFARITEGTIENINFADVNGYVSGDVASIGLLAGYVGPSVTISNIRFYGTLFADINRADGNIASVGGVIGQTEGCSISNVDSAIKVTVRASGQSVIHFGGFAGQAVDGTYSAIRAFTDASVFYAAVSSLYGGIFGSKSGESVSVTGISYLSSSLYVYDGENASLRNSAYGNVTDTTGEKSYSDFKSFANADKTVTLMVRDYLLPANNDGTDSSPVEITSFRQISLITAYPYMSFKIVKSVTTPIKITTYHRGFYGKLTYADGTTLYAAHPFNTSDVNLIDAARDVTIIFIRKES